MCNNIYVSKFFILLVLNICKSIIIIFIVYIYFDMFLYCIVFELVFWFVVLGNLIRRFLVEGVLGS